MQALAVLLAATGVAGWQSPASTQPPPAGAPPTRSPPAGEPPAPNGTITVTGRREDVQSAIDRLSYSIASDVQGATGTIADVLRNLPAVEVDPDGNPSLRGDPNVVILIDGQPSSLLRGPNRGAGLQQLQAGRYERVEIITTPSAAFGPEGSGGVINLISRRVRRAGLSGTVRANAGSRGSANGGASLSYGTGDTTLSLDANARRDEVASSSDRDRERLDPGNGRVVASRQGSASITETRSGTLRAGVEQALDQATRLSFEITGSRLRSEADGVEDYQSDPSSVGEVTRYARRSAIVADIENDEVRGRLSRTFGDSEHRFSLDAAYQSSGSDRTIDSRISAVTPQPGEIDEAFRFAVDQDQFSLKGDYARPLGDGAKLQLGYEFEEQDNAFDNHGARGVGGDLLAPLPFFTNRFLFAQRVNAFYGTLEALFGRVTAQAGLRFEQVDVALDQVTAGERFANDYFRVYPTLHLSYRLTEQEQLRASYSRRIQRPQGQDLNPFREYRDPFNFRAGNPLLRPQLTDAAELAWQRRVESTFYQATLYYRNTSRAFTDVAEELGGGILLTTRANLGSSRNIGLELVANRRLGERVTVNASISGAWNEIDAGNLGFPARRSGIQIGGRMSISWRPTAVDQVQLSGFLSGRTLRPQGYRGASGMLNLGYRRQLGSAVSLVATVRDLIGNFGETIVYDTPRLRDRVERRFGGRIVFVGLSYTFGGNQRDRREPRFDFEAGRTE